ncbi:MAG: hypothetical protein HY282_12820 [Nitrospirae bacterium]|nr:hypothetical protein [Candidatus Manganitrophaceae bacterium]
MRIGWWVLAVLSLSVYGCGAGGNPDDVVPIAPAEAVSNGQNKAAGNTFWVNQSPSGQSFHIALFSDHTGRQTTGSVTSGTSGGDPVDFVWTQTGPASVATVNCSQCSFQTLKEISGSRSDGTFTAEVTTLEGGAFKTTFILASGSL